MTRRAASAGAGVEQAGAPDARPGEAVPGGNCRAVSGSPHTPAASADKLSVVAFTHTVQQPVEGLRAKALRALGDLPPFSATLQRLTASLAGEDVSFSQLGDLIEKDAVVAGNILHLVNSALYARRGDITSVRHALSILGIDKVRNAVLGMSLARMWSKLPMP